MKNIIVNTVCVSLFLLSISTAFSASTKTSEQNKSVNLASVSSIVVDAKNNSVLFEKHSNMVMPIASLTKLMTAMVILDSKLSQKKQQTRKK